MPADASVRSGYRAGSFSVKRRTREQQEVRADDPDRETDGHLERELADDRPERPVRGRRELDHADHERDADRIVRARLTLEDRAGAPADLAPPEHGEHDGGVGGGERGAEQAGERPREAEQPVPREREQPRGGERSDDAQPEDRPDRGAQASPADPRAAVEEDHDERGCRDPLDRQRRDVSQSGKRIREQGRGHKEQRRPGHAEPLAHAARGDCEGEARGDEEHKNSEVVRLVHPADSMDAERRPFFHRDG